MKFFVALESGRKMPLPDRCKIIGVFESHGHKFILHGQPDQFYCGIEKKYRVSHFSTGRKVFDTNLRSVRTAAQALAEFLSDKPEGVLDKAVEGVPILNGEQDHG